VLEDSVSKNHFIYFSAYGPHFVQRTIFHNVTFQSSFNFALAAEIIYFSNVTIQAADGSNVLNGNFGTLVSFVDSKIMSKMKVVDGNGSDRQDCGSQLRIENLTVKSLFAAGSALIEVYNSTFHSLLVTEAQLSPLSSTPLTLSNVSIS
jgi:hypothetical protein